LAPLSAPRAPLLSNYIALYQTIEILNAAPKGKIGRLPRPSRNRSTAAGEWRERAAGLRTLVVWEIRRRLRAGYDWVIHSGGGTAFAIANIRGPSGPGAFRLVRGGAVIRLRGMKYLFTFLSWPHCWPVVRVRPPDTRPGPDKVAAKPCTGIPSWMGRVIRRLFGMRRRAVVHVLHQPALQCYGLGNGVAWVHGCPIGIATSADAGRRGSICAMRTSFIRARAGQDVLAPAVVEHNASTTCTLCMCRAFSMTGASAYIIHLTSPI